MSIDFAAAEIGFSRSHFCRLFRQQTGMSFTELMNSDVLDRALTCGAVYGFLAGIVAFICCYMGERIPHLVLDQPDEDYE